MCRLKKWFYGRAISTIPVETHFWAWQSWIWPARIGNPNTSKIVTDKRPPDCRPRLCHLSRPVLPHPVPNFLPAEWAVREAHVGGKRSLLSWPPLTACHAMAREGGGSFRPRPTSFIYLLAAPNISISSRSLGLEETADNFLGHGWIKAASDSLVRRPGFVSVGKLMLRSSRFVSFNEFQL